MDRKKDMRDLPIGYAMPMMQNMEVTTSYMGMTKEQKREMLTYELMGRSGGGGMIPLMPPYERERDLRD